MLKKHLGMPPHIDAPNHIWPVSILMLYCTWDPKFQNRLLPSEVLRALDLSLAVNTDTLVKSAQIDLHPQIKALLLLQILNPYYS